MNNTSYFKRNRRTLHTIKKILTEYNLLECYNENSEKIYKNENILLWENRKFILLRSLSQNDQSTFLNIKKELLG